MMSEASTTSSPESDAQITAEREETKYLIAHDKRASFSRAVAEHLPLHRFRGEGDNPLPGPEHFVTTVYFDTASRKYMALAKANPDDTIKLRAKEYYDVHPSLAELATDVSELLHRPPWLWLELKRRTGTRTTKHRVRLERTAVPRWLSGESSNGAVSGMDGDAELIRAYCADLSEPLFASYLVNYRRVSWQAPDATLRVTLDSELAFYGAPSDIWHKPSLVRSTLGAPRARETSMLIEIKRREETLPLWLERSLAAAGARPVSYSKFLRAAESLALDG